MVISSVSNFLTLKTRWQGKKYADMFKLQKCDSHECSGKASDTKIQ